MEFDPREWPKWPTEIPIAYTDVTLVRSPSPGFHWEYRGTAISVTLSKGVRYGSDVWEYKIGVAGSPSDNRECEYRTLGEALLGITAAWWHVMAAFAESEESNGSNE